MQHRPATGSKARTGLVFFELEFRVTAHMPQSELSRSYGDEQKRQASGSLDVVPNANSLLSFKFLIRVIPVPDILAGSELDFLAWSKRIPGT